MHIGAGMFKLKANYKVGSFLRHGVIAKVSRWVGVIFMSRLL